MLTMTTHAPILPSEAVMRAADRAARAIPPLWPLASSVAVNPFLGQSGEPLAMAAARLRRGGGIALTMPRHWYAERMRSGDIADADLRAAFEAAPAALRPITFAALKQAALVDRAAPRAIPTVAELARDVASIDWPGIVNDRIGHWASGYFDQGQALWASTPASGAFAAWRSVATNDLTPEILGLAGFAQGVAEAPAEAEAALAICVSRLGLGEAALESYFHRLLTSLGGWGQVARYRLWQAELGGTVDTSVTDLLAIRISWEAALLRQYAAEIGPQLADAIEAFPRPWSQPLRMASTPSCRKQPSVLRRGGCMAFSPHGLSPRQLRIGPGCRWPSASTCVPKCSVARSNGSILA